MTLLCSGGTLLSSFGYGETTVKTHRGLRDGERSTSVDVWTGLSGPWSQRVWKRVLNSITVVTAKDRDWNASREKEKKRRKKKSPKRQEEKCSEIPRERKESSDCLLTV